jgi:hypothetical protein
MNVVASANLPGQTQSGNGTYPILTYTPTEDCDFLIAGYLSGHSSFMIATWNDENGNPVNISNGGPGHFFGGSHVPAGNTITVAVQLTGSPFTYDAYATILTLGQQ